MNGYIQWGYLVCPSWPNPISPATPEDAAKALHHQEQKTIIPCRWTSSRYEEDNIPYEWRDMLGKDASVAFRVPNHATSSKELIRQAKNFRCLTHGGQPTKTYIRRITFYYNVASRIRKYWEETYKSDPTSKHGMLKLVMKRINHTSTIRNMWNAD